MKSIPEEIRIKTLSAKSFSMDYLQFGQGKEALVILPGLSIQSVLRFSEEIAKDYQTLADHFQIYLFDRRTDLPDPYPIKQMAEDTAKAIRALGLAPVNLFGVSQGGMIAMQIAVEYPELVNRLILASTTACLPKAAERIFADWITLASKEKVQDLLLAFAEMLYPKKVFESSKELLIESAEAVTKEELRRFRILAQGTQGFDITQDLKKIACPTLVIGDREDRLLGATAAEEIEAHLNQKIDSELYLYQGYGHAVYDLAPDYKERLLHFFLQNDSVRRSTSVEHTISLMRARHSVRQYLEKAIPDEIRKELNDYTAELNEKSGLNVQILYDEPECFNSRMAHYGHFENCANYISLVGKKSGHLDETCGYYGELLVLKAQELGLNTCWVALSHGKSKAIVGNDEREAIVISLGYGKTQGAPRRSKTPTDVSNLTENSPAWFRAGVEAALLAPTAINQQKFKFLLDGNKVTAKSGLIGPCLAIDLGIVKCHFELVAGKENFVWG